MFDTKKEIEELEKLSVIYFKEKKEMPLDFEEQTESFKNLYNSYPNWEDIKKYEKIIESLREITK